MQDQYFGIKQLYEVVLKARTPMHFGSRYVEIDEPILYFENINISLLSEKNTPIMARGGWANLPQVVWEDRSEVTFSLSEGVLSSVGMGILLSADVLEKKGQDELLVRRREGPMQLDQDHCMILKNWPVDTIKKKAFIYKYSRDTIQKKMYGKRIHGKIDPWDSEQELPCIQVYDDKTLSEESLADINAEYIIEYYYEYPKNRDALIYRIQKERFNGLFSLEGKFYSKDENEGINYTNLIYMPKVRVVSDINLRLGERADPTMSVFNIIGMPENLGSNKEGLILQMTRLDSDIDAEI